MTKTKTKVTLDDFDFLHKTNGASFKMASEDYAGKQQQRRTLAKKANIEQLRDALVTSLLHYAELL